MKRGTEVIAHQEPVRLTSYAEIQEALLHPDLSRSLDKRSWDEGNVRAGIVSVIHGAEHRKRRRIENPQFRRERLFHFEKSVFPTVCEELVAEVPEEVTFDLLRLAGRLSMSLSARRTGIDHGGTTAELDRLVELVLIFSKGSAIFDIVGDRSRVEDEVRIAYQEFREEFFGASFDVRVERAGREGWTADDVLSALVVEGVPEDLALRECAIFLQGGTTTSSHTVCSLFDLVWSSGNDGGFLERLGGDAAFAQRCVQETLRLRPTTPVIRRRVERPVKLENHSLEPGEMVLLDVRAAHRDAALFGDCPDDFNPDRRIQGGIPRWGLAFGAGAHRCIGRRVAGGIPLKDGSPQDVENPREHLFGLIAIQVGVLARRGIVPAPDAMPQLDDATDRGSRWATYPVRFSPSN